MSIYDTDLDGKSKLISTLFGPDSGPKSQSALSNWEKKIISSRSNKMLIEFKSDEAFEYTGFSINIQFTVLQNQKCESWLDTKERTLKSPNYPNSYDNKFSCHWLITVQYGFHIILRFLELNVSILTILTIQYILTH